MILHMAPFRRALHEAASHVEDIDIRRPPHSCMQVVLDPPLEEWPDAGVYQLWVRLCSRARVTVGQLGRFVCPAGAYVYTGRAARGLRARVARHVNGADRMHWHIDYLLAHRRVRVERVVLVSPDPEAECAVNQATGVDAVAVVPGFGASDCRDGCPTHLWLVPQQRAPDSRA